MDQNTSQRPLSVTLLIAVVLIFMSLNIVRAITAFQSWPLLSSLPLKVPVSYFIVTGTLWGVNGLVLVFGLLTRKKWVLPLSMILTLGYPLYHWIDRFFIAEWTVIKTRWQFDFGLTLLIILLAFWIFKHPKTSIFLIK